MNAARRAGAGLVLLTILSGCSSVPARRAAASGESVEAEGWAPVDLKDLPGTRSRALADAQRQAVEKVAGVFVAASTKVEAAVAIRQRTSADSQGWIKRYEVVEEKTEGGFLKVKIRAFVLLGGDDRPQAPTAAPWGTPDVEILIAAEDSSPEWSAAARNALRGRFAEHGFTIAKESMGGSAHDPFLLVSGEVRAVPVADGRLGEFRSFRATISVRVTDSRTGEIVLERSGEASGLDLDARGAAANAVAAAGSDVGDSAAGELAAVLWKHYSY